jgi:hypothetical protein
MAYFSVYPTNDANHVKATATQAGNYYPYQATDPAKSLTGSWDSNSFHSYPTVTNIRFHIDLGVAKTITRIYYENDHFSGTETNVGVQNFTFWGSNTAGSFTELTYATDTGWTQIGGALTFDQHAAANTADPKYITVVNTVPYQYYAFKFADTYGGTYMGMRRIELQILLTPASQAIIL